MTGEDDFESPYFDWDNDRLFDAETRSLIDQIAQDSRFTRGHEGREVADELAAHLPDERRRRIESAASEVFNASVGKELEREAADIVQRALADPHFDALARWDAEDESEDYFATMVAGRDPRLRSEIEQRLWASTSYRERHEQARDDAQRTAEDTLRRLPRELTDRLVLCSQVAEREALLDDWIGPVSSRRRGWIAYLAQRTAKESDEEWVLDRYASAAKTLVAKGRTKKAAAQALAISPNRLAKLLGRSTGVDIENDDPLCVLAPELIGGGSTWREVPPPAPRSRPKSFSSMTVSEREELAAETLDPDLQLRLAQLGSRRISEALIERFARVGDVAEDILRAIIDKYPSPWMRPELVAAHRTRPLPTNLALELATAEPEILMHCDDETAMRASAANRAEFEPVLAVRNADQTAITRLLDADPMSDKWRKLLDLLVEHPLSESLRSSSSLAKALLDAGRRSHGDEYAALLQLIACQNEDVLEGMIQASSAGDPAMSPSAIVVAALGSYHHSGTGTRAGVLPSAQKLWSGADLAREHASAREAIAARGVDCTTFETENDIFVAAADAIRCFNKSDSPSYTYVHLHLASTDEQSGFIVGGSPLPALGYHRELASHPYDRDLPEVTAIVWPLPFQPAIYSIGSVGLVAVSDGRTAAVEREIDDSGPWDVLDDEEGTDLRATSESGETMADPTEGDLLMLFDGIESGQSSCLIVELLDDRSGQTYAQTSRNSDGTYLVEYRNGGPDDHYRTTVEGMRAAHALITAWAFQLPGWREMAVWRRVAL